MITVSACCYKEITSTIPAINSYMTSPPDPIETCDGCGKECESIMFECPCSGGESMKYHWVAQCDIFDEGKFCCPHSAIPFLQKRRDDLPDCPFEED